MSTPDILHTEEFYAQMAAEAAEMASIEVVTWAPVSFDDHVCGRVIDTGTIALKSLRNPDEIDVWPTNTIVPIGEVVMDGAPIPNLEKRVLRVAWLGPVQLGHYERTQPENDDVIAMHYQSDATPKSGLNDYKLVNCIVFDHNTGKVKKPRVVPLGSRDNAGVIERAFGVSPTTLTPGQNPLEPRPGEEPL